MNTSKINLLLLIFLPLFLYSCSKQEQNQKVIDVLTTGTWIKHSFQISGTLGYQEFLTKEEYNFFENGKYSVTRLVHYFNDNNEPASEIVVNEDEWIYIEKDRIIDFKINDNPPENIVVYLDWKVLEVSSSKIFVEQILPGYSSAMLDRIMLVRK
jgi:hypothetical protein